MERYLHFVENYARSILFMLFAVTGFFVYALGSLTSDTNPYLLKESHPARKAIIDLQGEFTGTFDSVMIAFNNKDTVFNQITLDALYSMSQSARQVMLANDADMQQLSTILSTHLDDERAKQLFDAITIDGFSQSDYKNALALSEHAVEKAWSGQEQQFLRFLAERINPIREMASMADFENIVLAEDGTLTIHKSLRDVGMDPAIIKKEIMENELMVDGVVSDDGKVALLVAELGTKQDDAEAQLRAYHIFQKIVADYQKNHPEFKDQTYIAGMPIFIAAQEEVIAHDMDLLFPIVFLIILLMLVFLFRKPLGVVLPLLNILFCTIWTLGMMAILNVPMDLLTSVLPVFLFTICSADAIHYMAEYYEQKNMGKTNQEANRSTVRLMTAPIILTTVTTVATFLISTLTNIVSIRNFGIFMSFGLVCALIISLLLIPAWLSLFKGSSKLSIKHEGGTLIGKFLQQFASMLITYRKICLIAMFPIMIVMTMLTFRVDIEDSGIAYFKADSDVRIADEFVNRHVAGTAPGWIAIDSKEPRGMLTPEAVKFIDDMDKFIKAQPDVSYGYSLATYIKRMNLVLNDMDPAYSRVPGKTEIIKFTDDNNIPGQAEVDGQTLIEQHIMLFENSGGSDLTNVLNADYSKAITLYTMTSSVASDYQSMLDRLDEWLAIHKPANLEITHAGTQVIWTGVLTEITRGQLLSFTLALLVVTLVMMAWLRSWRLGLLGVLPLIASDAVLYACMYLLDIELNIGTALVTFLIIGIVDYTAHFVVRIKNNVLAGATVDDAILTSAHSVGRSIVFNVAIFSAGFLALLFSDYKPIVDLGMLVALALFISGVMTFIMITLCAPWFFKPFLVARPQSSVIKTEELHANKPGLAPVLE